MQCLRPLGCYDYELFASIFFSGSYFGFEWSRILFQIEKGSKGSSVRTFQALFRFVTPTALKGLTFQEQLLLVDYFPPHLCFAQGRSFYLPSILVQYQEWLS